MSVKNTETMSWWKMCIIVRQKNWIKFLNDNWICILLFWWVKENTNSKNQKEQNRKQSKKLHFIIKNYNGQQLHFETYYSSTRWIFCWIEKRFESTWKCSEISKEYVNTSEQCSFFNQKMNCFVVIMSCRCKSKQISCSACR